MAISAGDLLRAWEDCIYLSPADRALVLLSYACPNMKDPMQGMSLGRRDALLMAFREEIFGRNLTSTALCPECGKKLEISLDARDMRGPEGDLPWEISIRFGEFDILFRPPRAGDLAEISGCQDDALARDLLLERCILKVDQGCTEASWRDLTPEAVEAVGEMMAEADPCSLTLIDVLCSECGCSWTEIFDIVPFIWQEIDAWARRILRDVHVLARAYGWSETDILSLSPLRRTFYLEMVGG